jgi:hypothetical protein
VVLTDEILITSMLCYEFISRADRGKAPQDFIFSLLLFENQGLPYFCKILLTTLAILWLEV